MTLRASTPPSREDHRAQIAARLRKARIHAGMSQIGAAKHLRVSRSTILRWESGRSMPAAPSFEHALTIYGEIPGTSDPYSIQRASARSRTPRRA